MNSKSKSYLKFIKLYSSDYFLAFGFLFFIPFAAFAWVFMVTSNPADVPLITSQMIISCFILCASSWIVYLYLEVKADRLKINIFFWFFIFFLLVSVISVIIQPTDIYFSVECKSAGEITQTYYPGAHVGDIIEVHHHISLTHRMFFAMGSSLITTIFFIIFFVFPKRIEKMNFLVFIGFVVAIFILVLTIYSYVTESKEYIPFIKAIFQGDAEYIKSHPIKSFLVNRVPYGACLMMGMMFMLLSHHLTHKKYWLLFALYCYINMIFTWNKTALTISTFSLIFYVVFLLVTTFKSHKKRNIALSIIFGSILVALITFISVSIATKGKFIYQIYNLSTTFTESKSLLTRTYIWGNIRNELKGGWLIIGRGFGTHNAMLYPMNLVNGDDVCPSHSTYYGILGAGGIINFLGFAGMFVYFVYAFIKCWKVDKVKTIGLALPVLAYFLYSFTECINYLWLAFMFPIVLYYNLLKKDGLVSISNRKAIFN